mmetsp:Transcript_7391/g.14227  ORF Transcript_7391/g.14227 Transcript_7391/m.14227 type:complete len:189 (+) Transcript_7391:1400-1966(+)
MMVFLWCASKRKNNPQATPQEIITHTTHTHTHTHTFPIANNKQTTNNIPRQDEQQQQQQHRKNTKNNNKTNQKIAPPFNQFITKKNQQKNQRNIKMIKKKYNKNQQKKQNSPLLSLSSPPRHPTAVLSTATCPLCTCTTRTRAMRGESAWQATSAPSRGLTLRMSLFFALFSCSLESCVVGAGLAGVA